MATENQIIHKMQPNPAVKNSFISSIILKFNNYRNGPLIIQNIKARIITITISRNI